ncbi:hypothetical protein AXF42_Ash012632 [Apostasia shenzhenica]|uniref:Transmembrane and coiled-coil domain-containing protein 4 n=1 Tax=Apostasia shenzhenica TaxID=1088818 RepID=A0A2H9ZT84_9ASPA|nr:hypothetical protein AXF42_Ash012632 [Apostasia shenzhenica]
MVARNYCLPERNLVGRRSRKAVLRASRNFSFEVGVRYAVKTRLGIPASASPRGVKLVGGDSDPKNDVEFTILPLKGCMEVESRKRRPSLSQFAKCTRRDERSPIGAAPLAVVMAASTLSSTQRYAAGALLSLALRQAQIHQTHPLGTFPGDEDEVCERSSSSSRSSYTSGGGSDVEGYSRHLWTHESHGLLRPVFRFMDIDQKAWPGLEETAASSEAKDHIGAYLRIMAEEDGGASSEKDDQELALAKSVDVMVLSFEADHSSDRTTTVMQDEHDNDEMHKITDKASTSASTDLTSTKLLAIKDEAINQYNSASDRKLILSDISISYPRKVAIIFELLSACVADSPQGNEKVFVRRKGYDARHRSALRVLATWLDVNWKKVEAMEIMVVFSAMAATKEQQQSQESGSGKKKWDKWRRGGIIGAAALTGGALLAITGGVITCLAAPAIAAGFGALAPTLGTLVPVIGASGFAAVATAAGSVAGSVAVAASFGAAGAGLSGSKMARRIGDIEEFEFIPVGNHNQGRLAVGILISGFVFNKNDFVSPWKAHEDNLERYALLWESKHLISVSSAIQDWLTSSLTRELMKRGAMMTVLSTLVTALAWPAALLAATDFIDSKWSIAIDRSDKAGRLLAETLLKGLQGNRPVTLLGFSLGARVVFKCLQHLAESANNEGLVERVVLLGAPISLNNEQWEAARKMVSGRFINVYSTNDWMLGVTFRASLLTQGLAGIQPVDLPGIENADVTDIVDGHSSYVRAVPKILEQLELDAYYPVFSCARAP